MSQAKLDRSTAFDIIGGPIGKTGAFIGTSVTSWNYDEGGMEGEARLPLHLHGTHHDEAWKSSERPRKNFVVVWALFRCH